jgi:hypothetical protein
MNDDAPTLDDARALGVLAGTMEPASVKRDVARARADLRRVLGNSIRLLPSESGDYLEAEVSLADEPLVRLAANSMRGKENVVMVAGAGNLD